MRVSRFLALPTSPATDGARIFTPEPTTSNSRTFFQPTTLATLNTRRSELRPATMKSMLVIEHDGALQKILQRLFSAEGYEVDVVPDGTAGLEILRQRPPDAVIG